MEIIIIISQPSGVYHLTALPSARFCAIISRRCGIIIFLFEMQVIWDLCLHLRGMTEKVHRQGLEVLLRAWGARQRL